MKLQVHQPTTQLLLTVLGMAGIPALFLPFTYGTAPVTVAFDHDLWWIALPMFLSVVASAGAIRWIMSGSFSRPERAVAYIVSAASAGLTFYSLNRPTNTEESLWMIVLVAILLFGIYVVVRNSRVGRSSEFSPVMAVQIAYLLNAALCLMAFWGDWQRGAYCVLVTAVAFLLQIILISVQPRRLWGAGTPPPVR